MEDVKKLLASVKASAMEFGEIARLQTLKTTEEVKKQDLFYKLGKKYYDLYKDTPERDLKELVDRIAACDGKIAGYKEKLASGDEFREVKEEATADDSEADFYEMPPACEEAVNEEVVDCSAAESVKEQAEESGLDSDLEAFLDEKSYERKLDRLISMKNKLDKDMLETIAVSLDIELSKSSVSEQYEEVLECLKTMEKYECSRLRGF